MASNGPLKTYPRLHVELHRLSDTTVLIDGWLMETPKGKGRTVLRGTCDTDDAREQISKCAAKHGAQCDEEDIVMH
jgi:hypothetical protein